MRFASSGPTTPIGARPYAISAVLMAVPWVALLAVPFYSRTDPVLVGLPMFYWWTFLWIVLLAAATCASYLIIERAKSAAVAQVQR
jgi:hypothetical protein